jgi:hypothetical protein
MCPRVCVCECVCVCVTSIPLGERSIEPRSGWAFYAWNHGSGSAKGLRQQARPRGRIADEIWSRKNPPAPACNVQTEVWATTTLQVTRAPGWARWFDEAINFLSSS